MNYYRRYVGDYLRDTSDLSLAEHGAYCLLLDYYYADETPLPLELRTIYRRLRAMSGEERQAIDVVLGKFFVLLDDGYHQKRVDHEIGVSKKARDNGKHGGRPVTGSETGAITGSITGLETGSITGSVHPPTTNHQPPAVNLQPPTTNLQPGKSKSMRASRSPDGVKILTDLGVEDQIAKDWLAVRKAKRAPVTQTVIDDITAEAAKAGIGFADAIAICARRSWQGFNATWDWQGKGKHEAGAVNLQSGVGADGRF